MIYKALKKLEGELDKGPKGFLLLFVKILVFIFKPRGKKA